MKVAAAFAAKILGGPNSATQKNDKQTFGGVLSNVADDAVPQATTGSTAKQGAPSGPRDETAAFMDSKEEADAPVDGKTDTTEDRTVIVPPNANLLVLVQMAAFAPASHSESPVAPPSAATTTAAGVSAGTALPGQTDPSAVLVKAAADPLVSEVMLQSHLAPFGTPPIAAAVRSAALPMPAKNAMSKPDVPSTEAVVSQAGTTEVGATGLDARVAGALDPGVRPGASGADAQSGQSNRGGESTGGSNGDGVTGTNTEVGAPVPTFSADASMAGQPKTTLSPPSLAVTDAVTSLATQTVAHAATADAVAPARTMLLQLNSGDLGTVSVRLHLTGHTLDVSLAASNAGTASLLEHDRAALTSALGDRDYQINSLVIKGGDAGSTPGGFNGSTGSSDNRSMSQSTANQQDGGAGRRDGRDPSPRQDGSDRRSAPLAAAVGRRDDLFV